MGNAQAPAWWQTPCAWLYAWDFAHDRGRFLRLDRATLRRSAFLDRRIAADAGNFEEVPIADLLAQPIRGTADAPPGFIFHTAFCCSTLLARSLDIAGRTLVLREPGTLLQLADLKRGLAASRRDEAELLPLTLNLLARPFAAGERIIVKPTNLANNLAPELAAGGARALVLHDDLEPFLLAVLKRPRESESGITRFLERLLADPIGRRWAERHRVPESLAERAALAWTQQILGLRVWLADTAANLRVLAASELLAEPTAALTASAAWLGVKMEAEEAAAIVHGPVWARHAKHAGAAYSPRKRREEQALARRLLAEPVREGLAWSENHGIGSGADFPAALRLLPY